MISSDQNQSPPKPAQEPEAPGRTPGIIMHCLHAADCSMPYICMEYYVVCSESYSPLSHNLSTMGSGP